MNLLTDRFPWKISSTEMLPNILLMCKLLLALLILHGFYSKINDPFIPFIGWLDHFNNFPGVFKYSLRIGFIIFSIFLFINIRPKLSSFILGFIIILTLISSKILFRNHVFVVGCILILASLSGNKGLPWLIIFQISLMYFGASLNKALQIDWWTGQFMQNWLGTAWENPIYIYISELLPTLWFARIMSWTAIFVEFTIAVTLLLNKWRKIGVWLIIIFHFTMFTMLKARFGHFVEDIMIILLAFLVWPKEEVTIKYRLNKLKLFRKTIKLLDWDNLYTWQRFTSDGLKDIEVDNIEIDKKNKSPYILLLYTVGFYVILMSFNLIMANLANLVDSKLAKNLIHLLFCFTIWIIIFRFLKISFTIKRKRFRQFKINLMNFLIF